MGALRAFAPNCRLDGGGTVPPWALVPAAAAVRAVRSPLVTASLPPSSRFCSLTNVLAATTTLSSGWRAARTRSLGRVRVGDGGRTICSGGSDAILVEKNERFLRVGGASP
jgi:hypothetical protein